MWPLTMMSWHVMTRSQRLIKLFEFILFDDLTWFTYFTLIYMDLYHQYVFHKTSDGSLGRTTRAHQIHVRRPAPQPSAATALRPGPLDDWWPWSRPTGNCWRWRRKMFGVCRTKWPETYTSSWDWHEMYFLRKGTDSLTVCLQNSVRYVQVQNGSNTRWHHKVQCELVNLDSTNAAALNYLNFSSCRWVFVFWPLGTRWVQCVGLQNGLANTTMSCGILLGINATGEMQLSTWEVHTPLELCWIWQTDHRFCWLLSYGEIRFAWPSESS